MKKFVLLFVVLCTSLCAGPIVHMQYVSLLSSPGFFIFNIDSVLNQTLCDQFLPNVTTEPYIARLASLNDLTGTVLVLAGDPQALQKYQKVGLLALQAYLDPNNTQLAADVTWAMRFIVDGSGRLTNGAQALLDWVNLQNPANFPQLNDFHIFAPIVNDPNFPGFNLATQEQVGFLVCTGPSCNVVPEPSSAILMGAGLSLVGLGCIRRLRKTRG